MATASSRTSGQIDPPARARLVEFAGAEFDESLVSRADLAVAAVLARYPTLLNDEVAKLVAAWAAAPEALNSETVAPVFGIAHELAGYGETFGYPLVTILARSLCRLLKTGDFSRDRMAAVVDAHINALSAVIRNHIQGHGGDTGLALGMGLDQAISKFRLTLGAPEESRLRDEIAALQPKK
jgi:hypothetical protein